MKCQNPLFSEKMLEWGKSNLRDFPWRKKITPYRVLIGELLLQRTNSKQVDNVFNDFIDKYPSPKDLAASDEDKILKIIKPLGLYRRANALFKLANQIENDCLGNIPNNYQNLIKLFGVGKYIANAALCFSYNERVPIVDTNVIRIFKRFFNFKSDKKYIESDKKIWELAKNLLPEKDCRLYNYSLLDFGSLICKPKNPECKKCFMPEKCFYYNWKVLGNKKYPNI
jgi:A/G-specific adenine glycosylase